MSEINTNQSFAVKEQQNKNYLLPLTAMTTLFFLWGFITVLNDVLIPRLKGVFDLTYFEAMLVQFCFFGAYFIVSIPAGILVKQLGYKKGILTGLVVASIGCMLFYPAVVVHEYWLFLGALFVLAAGVTVLQVSANPYVAALGPEKTASSRLNLAQALNALGTTVGPYVGGILFFGTAGTLAASAATAESVKVPYLMLAAALLIIAIVFAFIKLPEIEGHKEENNPVNETRSLTQAPHLTMGVFAIFCYVGGEVAIGSFLVNFFGEAHIAGLEEHAAAALISYYWGGAMVGRFIGSAALQKIAPSKALAFNACMVIALLLVTIFTQGNVALYAVLAIGLFNSIMFPTIFSVAIERLGSLTSKGSGWLCLAIVGGALVPLLQGYIADVVNIQQSFFVPLVCYVFIAWYGLNVVRLAKKW
ncbi:MULTISPECIES: sugar MFS transporter [Pseudoalteromonas]|uniref:MFS transporter n=1 Tax=Pseudoalteromonas agarivorans TaxID=176102 RepID=A0ABR5VMA6_9GAMM|nr:MULTISPECIES: sugar MFS transporter [Pseudoalteromonas]MCQ8887369.1 sugar MFS transporter [Pseudoalteromonas agarivorans]AZN34360.1 sugar MFS transporter [Pseudoalteromonas sp. Xi13]KPW02581.1 L-fucose-proton symporter [Pseudoalteromonas sp. P1-11]KYL30936.1 MFS transporter [Pseudoalteromonas telluritireducens]MDC9508676.1 sugar MFS transporter [Pseudoalteromonas sp. Angola-4]